MLPSAGWPRSSWAPPVSGAASCAGGPAPAPEAPDRYRIVDSETRLTLHEMEQARAELARLRLNIPSFRAGPILVALGGSLAFGAAADVVRRVFRQWGSDWRDEDDGDGDPFERSKPAMVIGALGAGLVLTGLLFWRHLARERRRAVLEIRRLESLVE